MFKKGQVPFKKGQKSIKPEIENAKETKAEKGIEEAPLKKIPNTSLKNAMSTVLSGKCPDCGKNSKNCKC